MPTLNLSPATSSLLPPSIAASPIAPVGTGDGPSEAFSAMLAGLTGDPAEAAKPDGLTDVAAQLPGGPQLPHVRQDPAVWMPEDTHLPPAAAAPVISPGPAQPGPIVFGLDCEMPAFDAPLLMPKLANEPAPIVPPEPVEIAPKLWPLKLHSALTPPRLPAPRAAGAEKVTAAASAPKAALDEPLLPVSVAQEIPVAAPQPQPVPLAPPVPSESVPAPAPAAGAESQAAPVQVTSVASERATSPTLPTAGSPSPLPTLPFSAEPRPDQPREAETNTSAAPAQAVAAPELMKQIARAIETMRVVTDSPVAVASEPAQPAPPQLSAATITITPVQSPPIAPVASPPAAQSSPPAPVDLGRAEWVQAMVDRIAELPQVDGRREAQIRLIPDALGKVVVRIVERDERVQVTFNAETAQARQLLSEAAPRLQELAEARGLRFAQMEVGGGQPQDRRGAQDQQQPSTPQRPRSASAEADADRQPDGELIA